MKSVQSSAKQNFTAKQFHTAKRHFTRPPGRISSAPSGARSEGESGVEAETRYMMENFPSYPNLSADEAILERSENVYMMKCDFGWADLGTWHSIYEAMQKNDGDNVIVDSEVLLDDARNNVIKLPKDKIAVINGLEGFIVAEEDNVLLICKKEDSSALVRKFVNEIQMKKGEKFV